MQRLSLALLFASLSLSALAAQQPSSPPAVAQTPAATGAADRGKPLYLAYGCYACHGYNAQTGNGPRLQPPRMTAPQFTLYIRAPRTRQMPAYTTKVLSDTEATDIFAYVVSLPREPELKDVPLLNAFAAQQEPDPFNGTWLLNVAQSKMQPATASKSEIIRYRITGNEEDFLSDAVTIEGYPESIKYTARYDDGKPYPFSITINGKVTNPGAQTIVKKIDTWTRERYNVRDGKPVIASRRVVSKDGKTMTITIVRVDPQGRETVNEVRILEKQ
jgi:mono/diheme cytochrome c family protein